MGFRFPSSVCLEFQLYRKNYKGIDEEVLNKAHEKEIIARKQLVEILQLAVELEFEDDVVSPTTTELNIELSASDQASSTNTEHAAYS